MNGTGDEGARRWSRRAVVRSIALGAGAVGTAGIGVGQTAADGGGAQGGQIRAVIPEQEQYGQTVTGFFIHIGPGVDPTESSVADQCDFVDWADEETLAYDAQLIDRKADPEQTRITLYLNERVDVEPGALFIINDREQCRSGYLGIFLEPVGINLAQLRSRDFTPNPENQDGDGGGDGGGVGAAGPGMGVVSGLAGLLGGGWLLGRRRD